MKNLSRHISLFAILSLSSLASASPFDGNWGLTIPSGKVGWLSVEERDGELSASLLWASGSVAPAQNVEIVGDELRLTRSFEIDKQPWTGFITAKRNGDALALTVSNKVGDGPRSSPRPFTGKLLPALPPAPDLSQIRYGEPISLLGDESLADWEFIPADRNNGWSLTDGILRNRIGKAEGHYGNLRTRANFEDFRLTAKVRTLPASNSGIYLRGIYEIQIAESYGKPTDSHHLGALYSRIAPSSAVEKPVGEWQSLDIILAQRHLTVVLNGTTIIDNQPLLGCTGGALTSDVTLPGPIMLQGDHTDIDFKELTLYPVVD